MVAGTNPTYQRKPAAGVIGVRSRSGKRYQLHSNAETIYLGLFRYVGQMVENCSILCEPAIAIRRLEPRPPCPVREIHIKGDACVHPEQMGQCDRSPE